MASGASCCVWLCVRVSIHTMRAFALPQSCHAERLVIVPACTDTAAEPHVAGSYVKAPDRRALYLSALVCNDGSLRAVLDHATSNADSLNVDEMRVLPLPGTPEAALLAAAGFGPVTDVEDLISGADAGALVRALSGADAKSKRAAAPGLNWYVQLVGVPATVTLRSTSRRLERDPVLVLYLSDTGSRTGNVVTQRLVADADSEDSYSATLMHVMTASDAVLPLFGGDARNLHMTFGLYTHLLNERDEWCLVQAGYLRVRLGTLRTRVAEARARGEPLVLQIYDHPQWDSSRDGASGTHKATVRLDVSGSAPHVAFNLLPGDVDERLEAAAYEREQAVTDEAISEYLRALTETFATSVRPRYESMRNIHATVQISPSGPLPGPTFHAYDDYIAVGEGLWRAWLAIALDRARFHGFSAQATEAAFGEGRAGVRDADPFGELVLGLVLSVMNTHTSYITDKTVRFEAEVIDDRFNTDSMLRLAADCEDGSYTVVQLLGALCRLTTKVAALRRVRRVARGYTAFAALTAVTSMQISGEGEAAQPYRPQQAHRAHEFALLVPTHKVRLALETTAKMMSSNSTGHRARVLSENVFAPPPPPPPTVNKGAKAAYTPQTVLVCEPTGYLFPWPQDAPDDQQTSELAESLLDDIIERMAAGRPPPRKSFFYYGNTAESSKFYRMPLLLYGPHAYQQSLRDGGLTPPVCEYAIAHPTRGGDSVAYGVTFDETWRWDSANIALVPMPAMSNALMQRVRKRKCDLPRPVPPLPPRNDAAVVAEQIARASSDTRVAHGPHAPHDGAMLLERSFQFDEYTQQEVHALAAALRSAAAPHCTPYVSVENCCRSLFDGADVGATHLHLVIHDIAGFCRGVGRML